MTSALQQPGDRSVAARAAVSQRQMIAVSSAVRQNFGTASSGCLADDRGRTSTAASLPLITPFNQGARCFLTGAAAEAADAAAATAAALAQPVAAVADTPANLAATTPAAALDVVRAALLKANIEPSSLNLYYEEVPVYYPGGSYTNRQITLELSGGRKESYDVGLMMKNPWLTAFEIGRFMGYAANTRMV